MTADSIRSIGQKNLDYSCIPIDLYNVFLREIAAQLAELNKLLRDCIKYGVGK